MCNVLDPMALKIPMQEQIPPQMDSKPGMGAAAAVAAKYDTSPSLLRNPPPIPAETAHPSAPDMAQLCAMLAGVPAAMQQMQKGMDTNLNGMEKKMETNAYRMENKIDVMNDKMGTNTDKMEKMRGEMRQVGRCLQAGIMATPRAGSNELEGSAPAGEDRVSRETYWTRHEVTRMEKLNGVTETGTREITNAVTEIECTVRREVTELTETREEIDERLHGEEVEDAHTHTHTQVVRDNEGELAERVGTRCEQLNFSLP